MFVGSLFGGGGLGGAFWRSVGDLLLSWCGLF